MPVDPAAASVWQLAQVDTNTDIPAFTDTPALEPPPLLEVELLDEVFADPLVEVPAPDDVAVPVVCVAAPCPWVFVPVDGVDEDLPPPPQAAAATLLITTATATAAARPDNILLIA